MSDQYEITQATESGGLLRRIRINDGPWFVRVGEESDIARLTQEQDDLREALVRAKQLIDEALPKFDWGKSFLDANAIQLLNEVPIEVNKALAAHSTEG